MKTTRESVTQQAEAASPAQVPSLDQELSSLLAAIENEQVPEKLLTLALELQAALAERHQKDKPN